jgi:uncharacterized protein (DUF169 family)
MLIEIPELMRRGVPVTITFNMCDDAAPSDQLYCQLVHQAREGKTSHITTQECPIGSYVLGQTCSVSELAEYYYSRHRYKTRQAAWNLIRQLPVIKKPVSSIRIAPYPQEKYDLLILYLTPQRAMRLLQAASYADGERITITTAGVASVCADCTAQPCNTQQLAFSLGCKGSRKHSRYEDTELIAAIPEALVERIEDALGVIPEIMD